MRKTARENAFKLVFEKLINGNDNKISYDALVEGLSEDGKRFLDLLISGVNAEKSFLSKIIARYSTGFSIDRIYRIDLSILLIASYEILFLPDVPDKVSANEAVELAKIYSTDNSPSFINGLIATIIKNKEAILNERNAD